MNQVVIFLSDRGCDRLNSGKGGIDKLSLSGLIITLGIVFGDIGTSPLYVVRAISGNLDVYNTDIILGVASCIFWTLTLQTSLKYILITLRANNKGEGGILALYALIRRRNKWAYIIAIIGGSTLLADGIITPSITVTSAIEGLRIMNPEIPTILISVGILALLFFIQQFGTDFIGRAFGPIMLVWFITIGVLGAFQVAALPDDYESSKSLLCPEPHKPSPHGFGNIKRCVSCNNRVRKPFIRIWGTAE